MGNAFFVPQPSPRLPVHPHAHGERLSRELMHSKSCGSSPRTWGTLLRRLARPDHLRFIPTHMGNAGRSDRRRTAPAVHPHAHGERLGAGQRLGCSAGSSPRTWGTQAPSSLCASTYWFIPTHMGNAALALQALFVSAVHPHAHGERSHTSHPLRAGNGSSPRTWGTRRCKHAADKRSRFIPTHMGNAGKLSFGYIPVAVHPHAHGERRQRRDVCGG